MLLSIWFYIQARPVRRKGPHIRRFLDDLVGGLARTMARARLDSDEVWLGSDIRCLKRGDKFEGVTRHDTFVGVGNGGHDRRIFFAGADVVTKK